MSDAKPFAEAMSDGDEWYVVIDGIKLGSSCANAICHRAARINAAVSRARREAAAVALEAFAVTLVSDNPSVSFMSDGMKPIPSVVAVDHVVALIRTRASALRKGDG